MLLRDYLSEVFSIVAIILEVDFNESNTRDEIERKIESCLGSYYVWANNVSSLGMIVNLQDI